MGSKGTRASPPQAAQVAVKMLIPEDCQRDIDEIPQEVRDDLEIRLVKRVEDVWEVAFAQIGIGGNEVIG